VLLLLDPALGASVGGALIGAATWRSIFLINIPAGAATVTVAGTGRWTSPASWLPLGSRGGGEWPRQCCQLSGTSSATVSNQTAGSRIERDPAAVGSLVR
jgi:hypothetical protein